MSTSTALLQPVQGSLFDTGIDFSLLRLAQEDLMSAALAPNTIKAYDQAWDIWSVWCADAGRDPLPGSPDSVCMFVSWAVSKRRLRLASVRLVLAAIRYRCRCAGVDSPVTDRVRLLMTSAARRLRERPAGRAALAVDQLVKICGGDSVRAIDVRNRALMLVGFSTGMRCSELVALAFSDVRFCAQGVVFRRGVSKTDQVGVGLEIGIPPGSSAGTCPVKALRAWLDLRGDAAGPLFTRVSPGGVISAAGLRAAVVTRVLKQSLSAAGVDPTAYAAHSLRAGFVTASAEAGASELAIMRRTGHRSVSMVLRYVRPARAFAVDPLAGVL